MLTVVAYAGSNGKVSSWWCRCECGGISKPAYNMLVHDLVKSCGCLNIQRRLAACRKYGGFAAESMPEYNSWHAMKYRCSNKKARCYQNYGGRGITVCDRWKHGEGGKNGYQCFLEDMGRKPSKLHSLDRFPDNNGNYEPGNFRWATKSQQQINRRRVKPTRTKWHYIKTAPKDGTLLLYMGVGVCIGGCYWNQVFKRWCDPDRPGRDILPTMWSTMPYGHDALHGT